jgi:hypothetical protein
VQRADRAGRALRVAYNRGTPDRPQKITLAEMRASGVRGVIIYCSDFRCSHWVRLSADQWSDEARLSDVEPELTCTLCGQRGADVRPDFDWDKPGAIKLGFSEARSR